MLILSVLPGCSTPLFKPRIALNELHLKADSAANGDMPFAVELVTVSDADMLKQLQGLTAAQWFQRKAELKRDFPQDLQSWYYELVPGGSIALRPTPFSKKPAQGLLLFANYSGHGAYRLRLDTYAKATVQFSESDLRLVIPP